jgi:pyruvate/2-oxoglutarate dehydrogenase complex dihydrolipoamide acyltransferase (E2) component
LEFQLPALSADMEYATVGRWLKQEGDPLRKDEPLLEIEADKVTEELAAPASGTLREILALEGDEVKVGAVLAIIDGAS